MAAKFLICHLQPYPTAGRLNTNTHPPSGSIFGAVKEFSYFPFFFAQYNSLKGASWCHGGIIHVSERTQLRFDVQEYGVFWCSLFLVLTLSKTPNQFSFCYFLFVLVDPLGMTFLEVSVSAEGAGEENAPEGRDSVQHCTIPSLFLQGFVLKKPWRDTVWVWTWRTLIHTA